MHQRTFWAAVQKCEPSNRWLMHLISCTMVLLYAAVIVYAAVHPCIFSCVCLLDIQLCNPLNDAHVLWHVSCRRTQIRTWLFRKCLGHQKDHTCGSTKYLFLTWMRKRWRKWCKRVWLSTAAHLFAHVLRRSVSYLLGHPSVRPAANVKRAYLLVLHMFSLAL